MSNRLPIPGSDDGDWGSILNSFLEVSLNTDGTLNSNTVGTNQLQSNSVTNAQLDTPTQTTLASVATKYTLPNGGIPSTDLAGNVPLSLLSITGTASNSTYLRGDGSWTAPSSGSSTPPLEVTSTITTSATLTAGYLTPVNANSAAVTATLPTGASQGTQIGVSKTDSSANAVTISANVRGTANSTASLAYQYQTLTYVADSNGSWWPIGDLKPSSYFSSTYAPLASPTFTGTVTTPALTVTGGTVATGNILTSDNSGNATWQTPTGGSNNEDNAYNLGNLSTSATLENPETYGFQYGVLTANTSITLPAPSAGASMLLILTQDSNGGHIPSFGGEPIAYPTSLPNWITPANAVNVFEFRCWDGSTWNVFPVTSATTELTATTLTVDGATNSLAPFRFVGVFSGAPSSGSYNLYDVALDATNSCWRYCTQAGSPGTWTEVA